MWGSTALALNAQWRVATPYTAESHVALLALDVSLAAFALGELSQAWRLRRSASRADLRAEVIFRVILLGGILALPGGRALAPAATGGGAVLFAAGLMVAWLGMVLRWWSFATLGRYFTFVVKTSADQPVVDRGPYRVLRHPSYTGLLLAVAGCGLMVGNWAGAAAATIMVSIALVYRLRREERALADALGDRYRDFAEGRARLIPYVW